MMRVVNRWRKAARHDQRQMHIVRYAKDRLVAARPAYTGKHNKNTAVCLSFVHTTQTELNSDGESKFIKAKHYSD